MSKESIRRAFASPVHPKDALSVPPVAKSQNGENGIRIPSPAFWVPYVLNISILLLLND